MTKRSIVSLIRQIEQRAGAEGATGTNAQPGIEVRSMLLSFLDVLDSLDRLIGQPLSPLPVSAPNEDWKAHLRVLQQQMLAVFEGYGVVFDDCLGKRFDPASHEAIEIMLTRDYPSHTIVQVFSRGCTWQGQMLRYARVKVALAPEEKSEQGGIS